jgi:hypothetical protein
MYDAVKRALDPNNILNPGSWSHERGSRGRQGRGRARAHAQALSCTYCPKMCRHAVRGRGDGKESATPWALMGLANHVRKGHLALTPEVARAFYDCTNCLLCREYCLHGNDVPSALRAARALAIRSGQVPEAVATAAGRFRRVGSMFPGDDRAGLAKALDGVADSSSRSVLLVSCLEPPETPRGDAPRPSRARAGCALPDASVTCCGAPSSISASRGVRARPKNADALSRFDRAICDTSVCADAGKATRGGVGSSPGGGFTTALAGR